MSHSTLCEQSFPVVPLAVNLGGTITIGTKKALTDLLPAISTGRLRASFKNKLTDASALFTVDSLTNPGKIVWTAYVQPHADALSGAITIDVSAANAGLITSSIFFFDVLYLDGAVWREVPGQWQWPAKRRVTATP